MADQVASQAYTDFRARQEQIRIDLRRLEGLFVLLLILNSLAAGFGLLLGWEGLWHALDPYEHWYEAWHAVEPLNGLRLSCLFAIIMLGAALFRYWRLSAPEAYLRKRLRAQVLEPEQGASARRAYHVAEEMRIASALGKPITLLRYPSDEVNALSTLDRKGQRLYLLLSEPALKGLEREALAALMAHEISQHQPQEARARRWAGAFTFAFAALLIGAQWLLQMAHQGDPRSQGAPGTSPVGMALTLILLPMLIIGMLALPGAWLIQRAKTRKMKHWADARAVEWTRNPEALRQALRQARPAYPRSRVIAGVPMDLAHLPFAPTVAFSRWRPSAQPTLERREQALIQPGTEERSAPSL